VIEVTGIKKVYDRVVALDGVTFRVNQGEIFGILGSNGAGKSTLLKVLGCIIPPSGGDARINGMSILKEQVKIKSITAYLPEVPIFPEKLTGREVLRMVASLRGVDEGYAEKSCERIARRIELEELDSPVETYSKGMKQKLSIIAAFFFKPMVMLLDEPTSGLDPKYSRVIREMITESRSTVLVSTHSAFLAEEICHRVAILHRGRIIASGRIEELIATSGGKTLEDAFVSLVSSGENKK
jgi:ABC-2 type transport system ATP-binding protein